MKWSKEGPITYGPAVVKRNNVVHLNDDGFRVDKSYYAEESPRRWYFVIDAGTHFIFQVVSMAYHSGWDSWDKNGEAIRKYMNGEVEILLQKIAADFDPNNFNDDWIHNGR